MRRQYDQKVPLRLAPKPPPLPARLRSWQGERRPRQVGVARNICRGQLGGRPLKIKFLLPQFAV